jgi:hypothetical protein
MRTASLPEGLKPVIRCEATLVSNARVLRGERGQRAGTVGLGRLGGPCRRFRRRSKTRSKSISCELEARESERPVVARRPRSSRGGAKGPWRGRADSEGEGTDWRNPMTEQMPSPKSEAAVGSQITPMMKAPNQVPCESRMREIRTSGLTRGRERGGHWLSLSFRASLSTLLRAPFFQLPFASAAFIATRKSATKRAYSRSRASSSG